MTEHILHKGLTYAILNQDTPEKPGVHFLTPPELTMQLGVMRHGAGYEVPLHRHVEQKRTFHATREVLFVRRGQIFVEVWDDEAEECIALRNLFTGDVIMFLRGSHRISWVRDTELVEVKSGPYLGEDDKEWI